jgi:hypothetical protein
LDPEFFNTAFANSKIIWLDVSVSAFFQWKLGKSMAAATCYELQAHLNNINERFKELLFSKFLHGDHVNVSQEEDY